MIEMKINSEDLKLFKLIDLATNGNIKAKWEIIWKFDNLIKSSSIINGRFNEECQEYIEKAIFKNIEKFSGLKKIKKYKNF